MEDYINDAKLQFPEKRLKEFAKEAIKYINNSIDFTKIKKL